MGLILFLLLSFFHLLLAVTNVLMVMILIQMSYDRWKFPWLEPFAKAVEPIIKATTDLLGKWISKMTRTIYPEETRLIFLIISLWLLQLVIVGLF